MSNKRAPAIVPLAVAAVLAVKRIDFVMQFSG
jgi:hypothetical protein